MSRSTTPLSDTEIKKSKIKDKTYKLSDGQGLYLVVKDNGTKFFRYDYTFQNKRKSMSFGTYPEISLKDARIKRDETRKLLLEDIDPIEYKNSNTPALTTTFRSIAENWLDKMQSEWKPITYQKSKVRLEQHAYPFIGNMNIQDITRLDILKVIDHMQQQDIFELTSRVLNNIERVYKYAVTYGLVAHNIIADLDKRSVLKRKDVVHVPAVTKEDDIKELMKDIYSYGEMYNADISTIYALRLSPFVFLRPFNLRHLEWSEINFKESYIEIDAEKMKMNQSFILPLSKQALEIIDKIKPYSFGQSKFVFPSPTSNLKPISENTLNHALMKLGYKNTMTSHGFRSMFSTTANRCKTKYSFDPDVIEACLAHAEKNKVRAAYDRTDVMKYFEEKKRLVEWWANWLCDKEE